MCISVGGLLTVVGVSLICLAPGSPIPITRHSESELRLVFQRASLRIGDDPTGPALQRIARFSSYLTRAKAARLPRSIGGQGGSGFGTRPQESISKRVRWYYPLNPS